MSISQQQNQSDSSVSWGKIPPPKVQGTVPPTRCAGRTRQGLGGEAKCVARHATTVQLSYRLITSSVSTCVENGLGYRWKNTAATTWNGRLQGRV